VSDCAIRPMTEADIGAADRVQRLAFGTFLRLPDPLEFMGDGADIGPRWHIDPAGAFVADVDARLVGAGYATIWGSLGVIGPMMVHPDYWNRGIASATLDALVSRLDDACVTHASLVTFATSPRHLGLYQKHGFWARFLTAIVSRRIDAQPKPGEWSLFSALPDADRRDVLSQCLQVADSIHPGLDLGAEIQAASRLGLGDTVLARKDGAIVGFAVCHWGAGTEGGSGACSVKFAAVRPGSEARENFGLLLDACESLTFGLGLPNLSTAMNLAREDAYRMLLQRGYRSEFLGVAMHRPNAPGHNRPDVFVMESLA
jgi:GNAT superfamily N-acetyltransferase